MTPAKRARVVPILALALGWLCFAGTAVARADGDPASDILYSESAFIPADGGIPAQTQQELLAALRASAAAGFTIRVALIATPVDLGSDTPLWRRPELYARFLGTELSLVYHGRLLIAMPDGLAIYHLGHAVGREQQILQRIARGPGGGGLAASALTAIQRLSGDAGHPIALTSPRGSHQASGPGSTLPVAATVIAAIVIFLAWTISLWLRPPSLPWTGRRSGATPSRSR